MPKLYIMCGLAFSGKSTLAGKISEHTGSKLVSFDKLWVEKDKDQTVPKGTEGWGFIRKVGQDAVLKSLDEGYSVVYDDTNIRLEHRKEFEEVAKKAGVESIVVYLDTPLDVIKEREARNKVTGERHKVEPENFQTVLTQLQIPSSEENVIEFKPENNVDDWLEKLDTRF